MKPLKIVGLALLTHNSLSLAMETEQNQETEPKVDLYPKVDQSQKSVYERAQEENKEIPLIQALDQPVLQNEKTINAYNGDKKLDEDTTKKTLSAVSDLKVSYDKNKKEYLINFEKLFKALGNGKSVWAKAKNKKENIRDAQVPGTDKSIPLFSKKSQFTEDYIKKYSINVKYDGKTYPYDHSKNLVKGLAATRIVYDAENQFTIILQKTLVETLENDGKKKIIGEISNELIKKNILDQKFKDIEIKDTLTSAISEAFREKNGAIKILTTKNYRKNWTIFGLTTLCGGIVAYQNMPFIKALFKQS